VDGPGHGKDVVDGLNTKDKPHLKQKMSMVWTPEEDKSNDLVSVLYSMVEEKAKSLAEECAPLCLNSSGITSVKSNAKYAKWEASMVLKMQNYQVQRR
jgi:hypothetical protein